MTDNHHKISPYEVRQELRQLAKDLNFEIRQLVKKVEEVKLMLYGEAREIRREDRSVDGADPDVSRKSRHLRKLTDVTSAGSR